jgi:hypothetical protein
MNAFPGVALGVVADARARRRRRRLLLAGATVALALLAAALVDLTTGGGRQQPPGSAGGGGSPIVRGVTVRVPAGEASVSFMIAASAELAYDVHLTAPARSGATLTMRIAPGVGWTVGTGDESACRRSSGLTSCLFHFARGGNPGGTWRAVVHHAGARPGIVAVTIAFLKLGSG